MCLSLPWSWILHSFNVPNTSLRWDNFSRNCWSLNFLFMQRRVITRTLSEGHLARGWSALTLTLSWVASFICNTKLLSFSFFVEFCCEVDFQGHLKYHTCLCAVGEGMVFNLAVLFSSIMFNNQPCLLEREQCRAGQQVTTKEQEKTNNPPPKKNRALAGLSPCLEQLANSDAPLRKTFGLWNSACNFIGGHLCPTDNWCSL